MDINFVSLHNHTEYSFLDGAIRIKDLVRKAAEFGMNALAITDHGGLFGAVEFYKECAKAGIKPIIGFEAYVPNGSRLDKTPANDKRNHLILLASNEIGWKNLMKLSTIGYLEGFYKKPRIDMEVLRKHGEGIIATSACAQGAIPRALLAGNENEARKIALEYLDIFGKENFYFELQDHGIEEEKIVMPKLIKLGRELGIPFIVANDAHYLTRADAESHNVLLCIQTRDTMDNPNRYKFTGEEIYFKSPKEMAALFPDIPEAMENTVKIAERCNVNIMKKATLPIFSVPSEYKDADEYLAKLARDGLKKRYGEITEEHTSRLEFELETIKKMEFAGYFLIVLDFVEEARRLGIGVGCRGSAAGCLVFYAIGVTDVDPLKFGLLFERFLNPERISMPDADIDFAHRDRYKVIQYVIDKYGRDAVCQIINFGSMKAKNATKDVARVMGVPVSLANKFSGLINGGIKNVLFERKKVKDNNTDVSLKEAISASRELQDEIENSDLFRDIFRHALAFDGLVRQPGMHPGGVIIAKGAVSDWAPLFKPADSNEIMTQFDLNHVEDVGLVKIDFLGIKTLTALQETLRLIKKYHGVDIDLWSLPEHDEKTLNLFGAGETTGIFQFESDGMKEYLRKLKPSGIEDIISMAALYRPGPMDFIDTFINRKHGKEKIEYQHPLLESVLDVTYGVIVYQEQVMRISQVMGGFTKGQADELRKAMGKKQVEKMKEMGVKFVDGAVKQGIDKKIAAGVYEHMSSFAGYGFNKAHAAVYAHLSYQSAYLKAHYPLEYMTGYIAAYIEDQSEFLKMRGEAEKAGIRILPPDVNKSDYDFAIENGSIRIGLGAIKNVGKAAQIILEARAQKEKPYTSIFDVCRNTDNRVVNKKALESLTCAGAFDCFDGTRAQHFEAIPIALEHGTKFREEQASDQTNLFGSLAQEGGAASGMSGTDPQLPRVSPWPVSLQLQKEKDILGFYASGHPLDQYADEIAALSDIKISPETMNDMHDGAHVSVCGMIISSKQHIQKNGKLMGFAQLETFESPLELIIFSDAYEKYRDLLAPDTMVLASGSILASGEAVPKLRVDSLTHLSQTRIEHIKSVHVKIPLAKLNDELINELLKSSSNNPNSCYLIIHITDEDETVQKLRAGKIGMLSDSATISNLRKIFGKENVWLSKKNS